jgi:YaiO family outer membrane protein
MKPWVLALIPLALLAATSAARAQAPAAAPAPAPAPAASFDEQFQAARRLAFSGQREAALAAYGALLARSPGNADVLLGRGRLYAWMGRWPEAEADLVAVTTAAPAYADAWSALADLYLWSDRPVQAVGACDRWLAVAAAGDPAPLLARGRAYRAIGNYPAARADFQAARARGAEAAQVDAYLLSIAPRALGPDVAVNAGYLWSANLGASWTGFTPARADWSDYTLSVRRHFSRGSLALEALGANRFSTSDHAWALDGYADLWSRAYANLRYQRGPQEDLFPGNSWRAELFQGVGRGWELSASYDRLGFSSAPVALYGLGVGRYFGNWYLRWRHLHIPGAGSGSTESDRAQLRYYYKGDADNYAELAAGVGRSDSAAANVPGIVVTSHSWSTSATLVKFLRPRLGFKFGLEYDHGDDGFDGRGLIGTVYTRW